MSSNTDTLIKYFNCGSKSFKKKICAISYTKQINSNLMDSIIFFTCTWEWKALINNSKNLTLNYVNS